MGLRHTCKGRQVTRHERELRETATRRMMREGRACGIFKELPHCDLGLGDQPSLKAKEKKAGKWEGSAHGLRHGCSVLHVCAACWLVGQLAGWMDAASRTETAFGHEGAMLRHVLCIVLAG
eukprot:366573-Chlamydomonas_euryale.AAC.34